MTTIVELEDEVRRHRRRHSRAFSAWHRRRDDAADRACTKAYIGWAGAQAALLRATGRPGEAERLELQAEKMAKEIPEGYLGIKAH